MASTGEGSSKSPPLKTSKEVYDMIRTDPGFDARSCHIVYHDRVADKWMSCSVADWVPASAQGDVPWHRVWFIKYNDVVFWDREKRIFDTDLLRRLASGEGEAPYINFVGATDALPDVLPREFVVATFNVLFDLFDYRVTKLEPRLPHISEALSRLNADVILLQECTPKVLEFLKTQAWVRAGYNVAYTDLEPYGQITMARMSTVRVSQHYLTSHKKALHAVFQAEGGVQVGIWNVHIANADNRDLDFSITRTTAGSSNGHKGPDRAGQLEQLKQWVEVAEDDASFVGGDFNSKSRGKSDMGPFADAVRWRDAWKLQRREELGWTFDPSSNSLAEHNSRSGQPGRFDYILLHSEVLQVRGVEIFGNVSPPLSDHFGVVSTLVVDPARAADDLDAPELRQPSIGAPPAEDAEGDGLAISALTVKSAVVWIPPPGSCCHLDEIRRRLDPKVDRWMCHMAVAYPFVQEYEFSQVATSVLADSLPGAFSFGADVALSVFDHEQSASLVVEPGTEAAERLRALRERFSATVQQTMDSQRQFRPHLTIGRFKKEGEGPAKEASAALRSNESAVLAMAASWRIERLCFISREESPHFIVKKVLTLPGSKALAAEDIVAGLEAGLPAYRWHAVGAHLLGAETPDSDCDILAIGSDDCSDAVQRFQRFMETSGMFYNVYLVSNPHGSYLKAQAAGGCHVDVHYLSWHAERPPWELSTAELATRMGNATGPQAVVLSMVSEPTKILECVGAHGSKQAFGPALRSVKRWAKQVGLYGQVFGFPGGVTWAILTAKAMEANGTAKDPGVILQLVCETFAAWDWRTRPVVLGKGAPVSQWSSSRPADVLMQVPLATMPHVNTMRTVLNSTREMLSCAFQAGPEGASAALTILRKRLPNTLTLTVQAEDADSATYATAWISRQLARLLVAVERLAGSIAPECDWKSSEDDAGVRLWSLRYGRDNTGIAGVVQKLQERFYSEVPRASLLFEMKGS